VNNTHVTHVMLCAAQLTLFDTGKTPIDVANDDSARKCLLEHQRANDTESHRDTAPPPLSRESSARDTANNKAGWTNATASRGSTLSAQRSNANASSIRGASAASTSFG
jgi:hypothetical protein